MRARPGRRNAWHLECQRKRPILTSPHREPRADACLAKKPARRLCRMPNFSRSSLPQTVFAHCRIARRPSSLRACKHPDDRPMATTTPEPSRPRPIPDRGLRIAPSRLRRAHRAGPAALAALPRSAAQIRKRAVTMAWMPGLTLDYARAQHARRSASVRLAEGCAHNDRQARRATPAVARSGRAGGRVAGLTRGRARCAAAGHRRAAARSMPDLSPRSPARRRSGRMHRHAARGRMMPHEAAWSLLMPLNERRPAPVSGCRARARRQRGR